MEPLCDELAPPQEESAQEESHAPKPRFRIIKLEESTAPKGANANPTHGNGCSRHCCGRCRCGR